MNELKRKGRSHISIESVSESNLEDTPDLADDSFTELLCTKAEYEKIIHNLEKLNDEQLYHIGAIIKELVK